MEEPHRPRARSRNSSPHLSPELYDPVHAMELDDYARTPPSTHSRRGRSVSPHDSYFPPAGSSRSGEAHYRTISETSGADDKQPRKSMQTPSLYSLGRFRTDVDTERLVERRAREIAVWKVTPFLMVLLFFLGVLGAIAHHIFYMKLNGKPADNQLWMVRYGTALAFFTKATLVGSVILSYRQRIWQTFRKKAMTMGAIDGLFAATEDPTMFIKWEMIRNAKLAVLMAVASWLIPIAALLSPASLTTDITQSVINATCTSAPAIDFGLEGIYDFRNDSQKGFRSLIFYNSTDLKQKTEGWFDYFDQPSKDTKRLVNTAIYLKRPVQPDNSLNTHCEAGWNCTYTVHLIGPGYKCDELASGEDADNEKLVDAGSPFNMSLLAPKGNNIYVSDVDTADYVRTQSNGTYLDPVPTDLGVLKAEPVIWIGYAVNTSEPYPDDSPYRKKWKTVHVPKIFRCEHYVTDYTVNLTYAEGNQHSNVTNHDYLYPIINTTITRDPEETQEYMIGPESEFVRPTEDVKTYKLISTYHAIGYLLRVFLRGTIMVNENYPLTQSDISETKMINVTTNYPVDALMKTMVDTYDDMLISLLSENLGVVTSESVSCQKSKHENVYFYQQESLWIGYAIVILVTLAAMLIGFYSMWRNGVASDTLFSRILVTCRNPTLDRLSVGACLGSDPFPAELSRTKLRFGVLVEESEAEDSRFERLFDKVEHVSFGTMGETTEIRKGNTYAGLKRWRRDYRAIEEENHLLQIDGEQDDDEFYPAMEKL
ncbi:hypothetical protein EJ05DRAFT_98513 [Pseudovirgaria hyperparasitica]|uniref:Uncharacterized protein n=1 Tax=Pseudovirgaria hyperparasitica TaxID=470096 RepID=A0A6A6VXJ2_9PEZI|nr:uncharacterized protein EJ05DRAFT_98513 [Pseudovirgaria hyperparasitica]KAF2755332.1 hypothetical protein EJ05DRAFT_98513 [Pseudovirgaria hyperparasitica]